MAPIIRRVERLTGSPPQGSSTRRFRVGTITSRLPTLQVQSLFELSRLDIPTEGGHNYNKYIDRPHCDFADLKMWLGPDRLTSRYPPLAPGAMSSAIVELDWLPQGPGE